MSEMRPYRGKRIDNGEEIKGWYYQDLNGFPFIIANNEDRYVFFAVIPETVGQSIGIKDKNRVEYWEGNLVRGIKCKYNDTDTIGRVYYNKHHAAYWVTDDKTFNMPVGNANWWEVIGNFHDKEKQ